MNIRDIHQLYKFNRWANAQLLDGAAAFSVDDLTRDLGCSHRSILGTFAHILWGEWRWLARWQGLPTAGRWPVHWADLAALRGRWTLVEQEQETFIAALRDADLSRPVTYENPEGVPWTYPLQEMMYHIVNHSTYHRGQITSMLRQLNGRPVATDYLVFMDQTKAAPN